MRVELITMFYNEEWLAPFFFKHYSWVDKIHLFLDADTTDRTEEIARQHPNVSIERFKFPDGMDDLIKVEAFNKKYKSLKDCDYVILVDSDEFIFCNDLKKPIKEFLEETRKDIYHVCLWQIYEHETDGPLDINVPVYAQRLHGDPDIFSPWNSQYIKPIVVKSKQPFNWLPGNHVIKGTRLTTKHDYGSLQGSHWTLVDLEQTIIRRTLYRRDRQSHENLRNKRTVQYHHVDEIYIRQEYERHKRDPIVIRERSSHDDLRRA